MHCDRSYRDGRLTAASMTELAYPYWLLYKHHSGCVCCTTYTVYVWFTGLCLFNIAYDTSWLTPRRKQLLLLIGAVFLLIGMFIFGENITLVAMRDSGAIGAEPACASRQSATNSPPTHHPPANLTYFSWRT